MAQVYRPAHLVDLPVSRSLFLMRMLQAYWVGFGMKEGTSKPIATVDQCAQSVAILPVPDEMIQ